MISFSQGLYPELGSQHPGCDITYSILPFVRYIVYKSYPSFPIIFFCYAPKGKEYSNHTVRLECRYILPFICLSVRPASCPEHVSYSILRKTIEGYLDSVPSLTFNTIKTKPIMHASHSSRNLQSKLMLDFSHTSMVYVQYISKLCNPPY